MSSINHNTFHAILESMGELYAAIIELASDPEIQALRSNVESWSEWLDNPKVQALPMRFQSILWDTLSAAEAVSDDWMFVDDGLVIRCGDLIIDADLNVTETVVSAVSDITVAMKLLRMVGKHGRPLYTLSRPPRSRRR